MAEVTSLENAVAAAVSDAEKLRRRARTGDDERRRIFEELSRLEVELRKLRKRHQVEYLTKHFFTGAIGLDDRFKSMKPNFLIKLH